jgi:glutamine amidotransferase
VISIAIVDFGLGNLYSVKNACEHVGMSATITSSEAIIARSDAVILPGIGAFGGAMGTLNRLGLVDVLRQVALSSQPLIGICLGMQLFMTESFEFGRHAGLGIISGQVVRFTDALEGSENLKVPQVGWNRIFPKNQSHTADSWATSPLAGLQDGEFMYFVHSYYVKPKDSEVILSTTRYGNIEFCSSLIHKNIFATQFHPERSGPQGLRIYRNLASFIKR